MCNWWAQALGTEFAEKELVLKNFKESFFKLFDKSMGTLTLEDFDFTLIKDHLEKQREIRLNRPADEKKRE